MSYEDLRDLEMAGVKWELVDTIDNAPAVQISTPDPAASPTPVPPRAPVGIDMANNMATAADTMEKLVTAISEFPHPLRAGAANIVMPHIAKNPNGLVILTDVPSAEDDASGHILTGAAGEMLDKMLGAIGMSRDTVSIIPMIFWRTPGGRTPSEVEINLARPFVMRALELAPARVVLSLGTLAAESFAGVNLMRSHGTPVVASDGRTYMPIFHPNYMMLKPESKRDAWTALQKVENLLKTL